MNGYRALGYVLLAVGIVSASGCHWLPFKRPADPCPRVLFEGPKLQEIIAAVNHNNSQIYSFSTSEATFNGSNLLAQLSGPVAFQRPRRLRIRAGTGITGREVDLGSNDELFWVWIRRANPPAVLYARHDELATCPARKSFPIDPDWLIEALGIGTLDPAGQHTGPFPLDNNRLEIRTTRNTPDGPQTKHTIVDAFSAVILEQHVFDRQGQPIASSICRGHRLDPVTKLNVPRVIEIRHPASQLTMTIDLGNVRVNELSGDATERWSMPTPEGAPLVNLCAPGARVPPMQVPAVSSLPPDLRTQQRIRY